MSQNVEMLSEDIPTNPMPVSDSPSGKDIGTGQCAACSNAASSTSSSYIYALGQVEGRFPRPAIEKEFRQVAARSETKGKTDREVFHSILSKRENRYLLRQLCWVFTIEGLETYLLSPRDPLDCDLLVEAIRSSPSPTDVDVIIGTRGPIAPPQMCNGLAIPIVTFDQIYSFDRESLLKSIPRPEKIQAKEFASASSELFERILQIADNAGATDEHRALNYLTVRYPGIYATAAECYGRDYSLTEVQVLPSRLSGARNIVNVVFSYTNRNTDVMEKFFVRVDVTEEFPFLVSKLSPYYDR